VTHPEDNATDPRNVGISPGNALNRTARPAGTVIRPSRYVPPRTTTVADPPLGTNDTARATVRNGADCEPTAESLPDGDTKNFTPPTPATSYDTGNRAPTEPGWDAQSAPAAAPGAGLGAAGPSQDFDVTRSFFVALLLYPLTARTFRRHDPGLCAR
jgi:hypothetical protein